MITLRPRDPWRAAWRLVTGDDLLAGLLVAVAVVLLVIAWLPQMPAGGHVAYARWLSEMRARFGEAAATLQAAGLFTIARSFGFRALLSLLASVLLLRLVELGDSLWRNREMADPTVEWQSISPAPMDDVLNALRLRRYRLLGQPPLVQADRWPWADLFPVAAHLGALLLLAGLLITHLWGRVEGVIVQSGERTLLSGSGAWVALGEDTLRVTHSPGIVTFVEEQGPGVRVAATDGAGHTLSLKPTARADPVSELTVALNEDRYFAIPDAQLVIRLTRQPGCDSAPHSPVRVQVYQSPPGRLTMERDIEGDSPLSVDDVTLEFASLPYARVTATFNPGLGPSAAGAAFLIVGVLGSIMRPGRRFWVRGSGDEIEVAGDVPRTLVSEGDG